MSSTKKRKSADAKSADAPAPQKKNKTAVDKDADKENKGKQTDKKEKDKKPPRKCYQCDGPVSQSVWTYDGHLFCGLACTNGYRETCPECKRASTGTGGGFMETYYVCNDFHNWFPCHRHKRICKGKFCQCVGQDGVKPTRSDLVDYLTDRFEDLDDAAQYDAMLAALGETYETARAAFIQRCKDRAARLKAQEAAEAGV